MRKLIFLMVTAGTLSGCAGYRPNDKYDLTQGFETYGFGRDIEIEFYESGKVKKVKATSNVGSTIKGMEKVIDTGINTASKVF